MKKRILLINPPWFRLFRPDYELSRCPLGLGYIAGVLIENGYEVGVFNADLKTGNTMYCSNEMLRSLHKNYIENLNNPDYVVWKEIYSTISEFKPDVVGIYVMTPMVGSALKVSRLTKQIDPQITVVWGGPHSSMIPEAVIIEKEIDLVITGEGELTFLEYLELSDSEKWGNISGLVFERNGKIINTGRRPLIENLDTIPFPSKYFKKVVLNYEKYPKPSNIFSSRGCPFKCTYCGSHKIFGRVVRYRSVNHVMEEIRFLYKEFGIRHFIFDDDTFGLNERITRELCNHIISSRMKITWECETRANLVGEDIVELMAESGCNRIWLGVESGDSAILKLIKKGITREDIINACKIIKKNRMILQAFFMIGFPWDTKDSIANTVAFMKEINPDIAVFNVLTPYPGTEMFEYCKKEGMVPNNINWNLYYHQSPELYFAKRIPAEEFKLIANRVSIIFDKHNKKQKIKHPRIAINSLKRQFFSLSRIPFLIKKVITFLKS